MTILITVLAPIKLAKEKEPPACHTFFAVMDMDGAGDSEIDFYPPLATYY